MKQSHCYPNILTLVPLLLAAILFLMITISAMGAGQSTVTLTQTNVVKLTRIHSPHIYGICRLVQMDEGGQTPIIPMTYANNYFQRLNSDARVTRDSGGFNLEGVSIRVIKSPRHGKLMTFKDGELTSKIVDTEELSNAEYYPNNRYYGNDSLILQVEGNGNGVQLRYFFRMVDKGDYGSILQNPACKGTNWIISSTYFGFQNSYGLLSLNNAPLKTYEE